MKWPQSYSFCLELLVSSLEQRTLLKLEVTKLDWLGDEHTEKYDIMNMLPLTKQMTRLYKPQIWLEVGLQRDIFPVVSQIKTQNPRHPTPPEEILNPLKSQGNTFFGGVWMTSSVVWRLFCRHFEAPETSGAADSLYGAFFDAAPNLQGMFRVRGTGTDGWRAGRGYKASWWMGPE